MTEKSVAARLSGTVPFDASTQVRRRRLMLGVLALSVTLFGVKFAAWRLTGSEALFSDAAESVVNVVTGLFALFSVWLAGRPADPCHPYGHGKIEFFAAGLEGAMILLAAAGILREAVPALADPRELQQLGAGLALSASAGAANGIVGTLLMRRGRRVGSATLMGEGKHLFSDTITTGGVLIGLLLVHFTGMRIFDPLAACLVALSIAWSGIGLLREAGGRLMDKTDPEMLERVAAALRAHHAPQWIEAHSLRAWLAGEYVHIDLHVMMPRYWTLDRIHEEQQRLGLLLLRETGRPGEPSIHADPCAANMCRHCHVEQCALRSEPFRKDLPWTVAQMTGSPHGEKYDPDTLAYAAMSREITRSG